MNIKLIIKLAQVSLCCIISCGVMLFMASCGVSGNSVTVTTQQGVCPNTNITSAPYCMAVTVQNSTNGGQPWITSTNFPISNLSMTVSSNVSNIQTPSTTAAMDPNNCTGSIIQPAANCTFYLQLNGEGSGNSVATMQPVAITLNYTVNSNLFGGGLSGSSQFTVYEATNLYILQSGSNNSAWVSTYNSSGLSGVIVAESVDAPVSVAIDNKIYGFVYIGGSSYGAYAYGNGIASKSILSGVSGNVSNLFVNSGSLYTVVNGSGVYSYNLAKQTFSTTATYSPTTPFTANVNTISTLPVYYLVNGSQVYACPAGGTPPMACPAEAVPASGTIVDLGFSAASNGCTGLYATISTIPSGGKSSLYAETGTTSSATNPWANVVYATTISSPPLISVITTDAANNLYAGDAGGNIWYTTNANPLTLQPFTSDPATNGIVAMVTDNSGGMLYVIDGANNLYSCSISASLTPSSCDLSLLGVVNSGAATIGMVIGSQLLSSLPN